MYEIREIVLKNGPVERKRLVIEFHNQDQQIVGEFLMVDANLLEGKIVREIKRLMVGEKEEVQFSGNRCFVKVRRDKTYFEDLYEDVAGMKSYPPYEMDTNEFYELVNMWFKRQAEFRQNLKK